MSNHPDHDTLNSQAKKIVIRKFCHIYFATCISSLTLDSSGDRNVKYRIKLSSKFINKKGISVKLLSINSLWVETMDKNVNSKWPMFGFER